MRSPNRAGSIIDQHTLTLDRIGTLVACLVGPVATPRKICYNFTMKSDAAKRLVAELGRKYLWWDPVGDRAGVESQRPRRATALGYRIALSSILISGSGKARLVRERIA
jgi:hypothetical protein